MRVYKNVTNDTNITLMQFDFDYFNKISTLYNQNSVTST